MSLASQIAFAAAAAQTALEAAYPVTITIGGEDFTAAGASPGEVPTFDAHGGGQTPTRQRYVHIRRALLAEAEITIIPYATDAELDGETWKITELQAPKQSVAFRLTLVCTSPEAAQT